MSFKRVVWTGLLGSMAVLLLAPVARAQAPTCSNAFTNPGFESGNFTGWTIQDIGTPFFAVQVGGAGINLNGLCMPACGVFITAPTEGTLAALHGFDGSGPATIRIGQDLAVHPSQSTLQFDYRAAWNMVDFNGGGTLPRHFRVEIEPAGGGPPLQSSLLLTAMNDTRNLDTGNLRGTIDIAPFGGQNVRVSFEWEVPEVNTGPALFQLDNVMPLLEQGFTVGGNGVFEPGETNVITPSWLNCSTLGAATTATASAFAGPGTSTYTIDDNSADYGTIGAGAAANCSAGGCYTLTVSAPATRPAVHWDAQFRETLSKPGLKDWALHVGNSFTDVASTSGFYPFIETLLHRSVTGGCGAGDTYCPASLTTRQEMAVFVLVANDGPASTPPACTVAPFADVPITNPFCRWIAEIAQRGVVAGCGGGNYCPASPVLRQEMAVFALATLDPTPPPPCITQPFSDVNITSPFCPAIQELKNRGVVAGCDAQNYCPAAPVTRREMAVFITGTFGLTLYGP
jgi:hypothetical protein